MSAVQKALLQFCSGHFGTEVLILAGERGPDLAGEDRLCVERALPRADQKGGSNVAAFKGERQPLAVRVMARSMRSSALGGSCSRCGFVILQPWLGLMERQVVFVVGFDCPAKFLGNFVPDMPHVARASSWAEQYRCAVSQQAKQAKVQKVLGNLRSFGIGAGMCRVVAQCHIAV